jgi:hypothetical protein
MLYLGCMNLRLLTLVCSAIACSVVSSGQTNPHHSQVVAINGPTVVAFFSPDHSASARSKADGDEAFSDFQLYAEQARKLLAERGIDFERIYAGSFRLKSGNSLTTFDVRRYGVGYYLIAPGKKPQILRGVMTDSDLLAEAGKYFSLVKK